MKKVRFDYQKNIDSVVAVYLKSKIIGEIQNFPFPALFRLTGTKSSDSTKDVHPGVKGHQNKTDELAANCYHNSKIKSF